MPKYKPVNMTILLRQVNAIRVAFQNEPVDAMPQGLISDPYDCPIAIALSNGWVPTVYTGYIIMETDEDITLERADEIVSRLRHAGFKHVRTDKYAISFDTTQTMRNFMSRFDTGEFTELVKGQQ